MSRIRFPSYAVLILAAMIAIFPFVWMASASLMTQSDVVARRLIPSTFCWKNYLDAWRDASFGLYFRNSLIVASLQVLGIWVFCSLAAYPLARMSFPGQKVLFSLILATLMIPQSVTLVPNFLTISWLDKHTLPFRWINNWPSLTVPFMVDAFAIFLLRQFFLVIPEEFWDAARVDGAGHVRFLFHVIIPMSKAPLLTIGMLSFMGAWNSLAWPLLVTNTPDWRPISVGLRNLVEESGIDLQIQMAGSLIAVLPVVFLYFLIQRQFTESIVQSGIKG